MPTDTVEFVDEDDGRVTARYVDSSVASFGGSEAEVGEHTSPPWLDDEWRHVVRATSRAVFGSP
jgi:hypothetical protein